MNLPQRRCLYHNPPSWVDSSAIYFLTINCHRRGQNQLCRKNEAKIILQSARFYHERKKWFILLILLMPDHLHALLSFGIDQNMSSVVRAWKGYVAKQTGIGWQRGFFDHRLRKDENLEEKAFYIRENPVRQGLAKDHNLWPYVWEIGKNQTDDQG